LDVKAGVHMYVHFCVHLGMHVDTHFDIVGLCMLV